MSYDICLDIYFLCELLTNLWFNSSSWRVIEPQESLTMPFNVYNEENCIHFLSKSHTAGWPPGCGRRWLWCNGCGVGRPRKSAVMKTSNLNVFDTKLVDFQTANTKHQPPRPTNPTKTPTSPTNFAKEAPPMSTSFLGGPPPHPGTETTDQHKPAEQVSRGSLMTNGAQHAPNPYRANRANTLVTSCCLLRRW